MGTKQVQFYFQIVADDGVSANVSINVGGVQKFAGALAHTNSTIPIDVWPDTPQSMAQFDLDIDNFVTGSGQPTTNEDITLRVTGGTAIFKSMWANYSVYATEVSPPTTPPTWNTNMGTSTEFVQVLPTAQPTWNGIPITGNMDFTNTPYSPMTLAPGQALAFPVAMPKYSS